jgi:hypothetical protein
MVRPIRFDITYRLKDFFFDRVKVQDAIGRAEAEELAKIGAFIRTTARRKVLRRRKRVSAPGEPPSVHSTDRVATLKNILFAYEPTKHRVIVGPVKLNQVNRMAGTTSSEPVPSILEFGGVVSIHEEQYKNSSNNRKWFRRDMRYAVRPDKKNYRTRQARYAARPFMAVALQMEIDAGTIRNVWRASVKARG